MIVELRNYYISNLGQIQSRTDEPEYTLPGASWHADNHQGV